MRIPILKYHKIIEVDFQVLKSYSNIFTSRKVFLFLRYKTCKYYFTHFAESVHIYAAVIKLCNGVLPPTGVGEIVRIKFMVSVKSMQEKKTKLFSF